MFRVDKCCQAEIHIQCPFTIFFVPQIFEMGHDVICHCFQKIQLFAANRLTNVVIQREEGPNADALFGSQRNSTVVFEVWFASDKW